MAACKTAAAAGAGGCLAGDHEKSLAAKQQRGSGGRWQEAGGGGEHGAPGDLDHSQRARRPRHPAIPDDTPLACWLPIKPGALALSSADAVV